MIQERTPIDWALLPVKKYVTFRGRAPRAEYWWFYLGTLILSAIVGALDRLLGTNGDLPNVVNLALLLPWLAVNVRRLHDTGRSGWWLPGLGGAVIALIAALAGFGLFGFGASTATAFTSAIVALLIVGAAGLTFLAFMVLPGTQGPNRYGPDPYGGHDELEEVFA